MNIFASKIYRIVVPKYFRTKIVENFLPKAIINYYDSLPKKPSAEIDTALNYLRRKPLAVFPYDFQDEYIEKNIEVFEDSEKGLKYVLLDDKKLYFKKRWGKKKIQHLYNLLCREQDTRSPHRYLAADFGFDNGEILVDVGAAEGNFALSIVEKASKIILFEADKEWIEPLRATFEPWEYKVEIINKFVSDSSDLKNTKIDDCLLTNKGVGIFLKIDVEGAESSLLKGSKRFLSEQMPMKVAICTYHKQNDEIEFSSYLKQIGFKTKYTDGFMLFFYDKKIKAPYFRRGLIRAEKMVS